MPHYAYQSCTVQVGTIHAGDQHLRRLCHRTISFFYYFQDDDADSSDHQLDTAAPDAHCLLPATDLPNYDDDDNDEEDEGVVSDWEDEEENDRRIVSYAKDY